jgi:hypothetical protein
LLHLSPWWGTGLGFYEDKLRAEKEYRKELIKVTWVGIQQAAKVGTIVCPLEATVATSNTSE